MEKLLAQRDLEVEFMNEIYAKDATYGLRSAMAASSSLLVSAAMRFESQVQVVNGKVNKQPACHSDRSLSQKPG